MLCPNVVFRYDFFDDENGGDGSYHVSNQWGDMIDIYEPSLYVGKAPEHQRSTPQTGRYTNILESSTETGSDFIGAFTFVGVWNNRLMTKREACLMAGMSAAVCPPSITSIPVHFPRSPPFTPKQWTCLTDADQPLPTYLLTPSSPYSTTVDGINSTLLLFFDNSTREHLDTESENDAGLNGGEIFGVIVLVVVIVLCLAFGGMWYKNRKEAKLGHAAKFPTVAHLGAKIHREILPRHPRKTPKPAAEAKSKATHNRVFGPIHHDNRDLTHHEHFKSHTADVGTGRHPVKTPTNNPKKDAPPAWKPHGSPPSWKPRGKRGKTAPARGASERFAKNEGVRTVRQKDFLTALNAFH